MVVSGFWFYLLLSNWKENKRDIKVFTFEQLASPFSLIVQRFKIATMYKMMMNTIKILASEIVYSVRRIYTAEVLFI